MGPSIGGSVSRPRSLSRGCMQPLGAGELPPPTIDGARDLGELVLGLPYIQRTCDVDQCAFEARLVVCGRAPADAVGPTASGAGFVAR
jgi:hypothetical protein